MPIVGIGTTMENENALRSFFGALPPAPNMAFAVVPASVPDASRTHSLSGVLRDCTDLAVQPLSEGTRPAPGTVSVCPPGRQVRLHDGQFHLANAGSAHASPGAVDTLFRSLVAERGGRAIGVLLGNTLPDGLLGLRSFKEHGALVLAEMPEARGPDTPLYLEDELVDTYDRADQLAADLPQYWACAADSEDAPEQNEDLLTTIFARLYAETDHDFSKYERSTVWRRIQRRMAVHHLSSPDAYLDHIQRDPAEVQALFRELLISVTSFFRTPAAFQALEEQVIPRLFAGKDRSDCVRVWSAGCATGEEAYSLAMLLDEHAASLPRAPEIQIFATDPSPQAIRRARDGRYARSVVAELSEARRARHLRQVGENYRIKKALRDRVLFAQHDLLTDPPFSKIDLVACRNVLIYLQRSVHSRVLRLLHYGLRPGGILFLGEAESAHEESDLFAQLVGDIEANRSRVLDALAGKGGGSAAEGSSGTAAAGSTPGIPDEAGAERAGASDQTGGDAPPHGEAPAPDEPVHIGNGPAADGPVSTADEASSTDQAADRAPTPEGGAAAGPETDDVDAQPAGGPGDAPSDAMDAASAMGGDSTGRSEAVPGGVPKAPPESGVSAAEADASAPPTADDTTATSATEVVTDDAGVEDGRQPVPPADGPQGSDPTPEPGSGSTTAGTSGTDDHSSGTASTAGTSTPAAESSGTGDGPTSGSDGAEPAAAAPAGSDAGTGVLVRVTTDVGEIFGVDGRSYDLSAGDVTVLPPDNATVLIEDGAAERLQSAVPFSGGRSSTRS
jgi:chemotaxis methyl-accepting protein methylase